MISSKEETQKRMLSNKVISPKNAKLGSMAHIANRSPTNRFENKTAITTNTLSSKKQLLQSSSKNDIQTFKSTSPRQSLQTLEKDNRYHQNQQPKGNIHAEKSALYSENTVPQRFQVRSAIRKANVEEISSTHNIQRGPEGIAITLPNGDSYKGQFVNKKYQGNGQYFFKQPHLVYKGQFYEGFQHGQGILFNHSTKQLLYQGLWQMGKKSGNGTYNYGLDEYYNGEWKNNQKHGNGFFSFRGGSYNGQWSRNKASGRGNLKLQDGIQFKGKFQNNQFIEGTVKYPNGDQYYGTMLRNKRSGQDCSYIHCKQQKRYKGGYLNDKKHGKGTVFFNSNEEKLLELTGSFRDGFLDQAEVVTVVWKDRTIFNGWLKNGQPEKGTLTQPDGKQKQI